MLSIHSGGPARNARRIVHVPVTPSGDDHEWMPEPGWSWRPCVPVHASRALQHEVDRCEIGHEEVEVQVEGLLEYLGAHNNVARRSIARSAEAPCEPALALQAVAGHEACVQQRHLLGAESVAKRDAARLRACDRVANDEAASALAYQAGDLVDE
jgi:hypothetical protein